MSTVNNVGFGTFLLKIILFPIEFHELALKKMSLLMLLFQLTTNVAARSLMGFINSNNRKYSLSKQLVLIFRYFLKKGLKQTTEII